MHLLLEAIQDHSQVQRITWGDFARYLLEDANAIAQVFFKECLEVFQGMCARLNIRA